MKQPDLRTLMARIYEHYPRGMQAHNPQYLQTAESRRLASVLEACAANMGGTLRHFIPPEKRLPVQEEVQAVLDALRGWLPFKQALQGALPDSRLWDRTIPWHDPCYRCDISQPGFRQGDRVFEPVVCLLSALAPVYVLYIYEGEVKITKGGIKSAKIRYSEFPENFQERETKAAALIEGAFHFFRLTEKTLLLPVPDVQPRGSNLLTGKAKLVDCLFTAHRW